MKIALVDDQQYELDQLYSILVQELPEAAFYTFSNGESFLDTWESGAYDLIILDMFMSELLGIDVARKVRETDYDVRIVFCTTSNEFASESYEVGANYYLHKPITTDSISRMLKSIRLAHYETSQFIRLSDGQRIILRSIISTEYHNHTILIHCKNKKNIQTRMSQTEWEDLLSDHTYFYSCSKGIVVNFYEVTKQEPSMFHMSNNSTVPISRRKSKEAQEKYALFRFHQLRKGGL